RPPRSPLFPYTTLFRSSLDAPGPFETRARQGFFNVTLPEKDWPKEKTEDYLAGHCRPIMTAVAIHEVYPGHFTQHLWEDRYPSRSEEHTSELQSPCNLV